MKRKIECLLIWMALMCTPCFAISVYMGIQPGLSTREDVNKILGQPINTVSETTFEYALPSGSGKIFIEYRADSSIVDRIERYFLKPVSRAALVKSLSLPETAEEKEKTKEGKLVEYFGGAKVLSLNYASDAESGGVKSLCYYSFEMYDRMLNRARNQEVRFDPAACRDIYFWAQSEREIAKRSKDVIRHQTILEILIVSQRGECEKVRALAATYKERYR